MTEPEWRALRKFFYQNRELRRQRLIYYGAGVDVFHSLALGVGDYVFIDPAYSDKKKVGILEAELKDLGVKILERCGEEDFERSGKLVYQLKFAGQKIRMTLLRAHGESIVEKPLGTGSHSPTGAEAESERRLLESELRDGFGVFFEKAAYVTPRAKIHYLSVLPVGGLWIAKFFHCLDAMPAGLACMPELAGVPAYRKEKQADGGLLEHLFAIDRDLSDFWRGPLLEKYDAYEDVLRSDVSSIAAAYEEGLRGLLGKVHALPGEVRQSVLEGVCAVAKPDVEYVVDWLSRNWALGLVPRSWHENVREVLEKAVPLMMGIYEKSLNAESSHPDGHTY